MSDVVLQLLVVLILVMVEAVFVAAEIALVTLRHSRIDQMIEEGHRNARRVKRLVEDPARFLAVAQIGVTFVGFLASAYAAVNLAERLSGVIAGVDALKGISGGLAVLIVTMLLAAFTIVFGELVPKTLALAYPDRVALTLAGSPERSPAASAPESPARPRSTPRNSSSSSSGEGRRAFWRPRKSR